MILLTNFLTGDNFRSCDFLFAHKRGYENMPLSTSINAIVQPSEAVRGR